MSVDVCVDSIVHSIVHGVRCGNAHAVGAIPMMFVSACVGWVLKMVA